MNKNRPVFWGIFWILSALVLLAWQFTSLASLGLVSIIATILLLAGLVQGIINRSAFGIIIPITLLYVIWQRAFDFLPYINPIVLVAAAVLLSIGLGMIIKPKNCQYQNHSGYVHTYTNGVHPPSQYNSDAGRNQQ